VNPAEFLDEFQAEASEKLDIINTQLLRLERDASNPQPVREMFLAAHTVKGGAAMLRLTAVEALAHALEDLLSAFRDEQRTLDSATADLLFQSIDQLRELIASTTPDAVGAELDPRIGALAQRLRLGGSSSTHAQPTARALVVDDSATVRELHGMLLQRAGFEVEMLDAGDLAATRARHQVFAVVVAGLELRGLSGFELCAALRRMPAYAEARIILMSADADATRAEQARQSGATALVRKASFHDEQLTSALVV
jgi:chemotaxis protein histidine kinase CheA